MASPRRRLDQTGRVLIAPSLLAADFAQLREQVQLVEGGEADLLHLDVMDGHFVSNISFGPGLIAHLRPNSNLFFDVHLMIEEPKRYAEDFVKAGADLITFHIEVTDKPNELVDHIRGFGISVGVCINPTTPVSVIESILDDVDMVLVMSIWPGFGGQEFMPEVLPKVEELHRRLRPDQRLEIDGGINSDTIASAVAAGVDTFVAGSAIFGKSDPVGAMTALRKIARDAADNT